MLNASGGADCGSTHTACSGSVNTTRHGQSVAISSDAAPGQCRIAAGSPSPVKQSSHGGGVIAVSNGMRSDILACYPGLDPERVQVIYNGIDTDFYRPAPHALLRFYAKRSLKGRTALFTSKIALSLLWML